MTKFYQDISASGGTIRTHELREPRAYYGINKGIKSGDVIRIKNGVYMLPEELATTMVDVERIVPGGVVCMYSAWDYYGLTTQIPDGFYVAIEKHRKVVAPEISGIVLCYWEEKYCKMGVEEADIANHKVKIFCIEKSVCDAIKFRNKIGTEVAVEILRNYLKRKNRNISRLMDYAKQMRVLSPDEMKMLVSSDEKLLQAIEERAKAMGVNPETADIQLIEVPNEYGGSGQKGYLIAVH
jgi:predicted transcriptional regulator of viral defense system